MSCRKLDDVPEKKKARTGGGSALSCDRREVGRRGLGDDLGSLGKDRDGDRGEQHEGGGGGKQLGHLISSKCFVAFDIEMPRRAPADAAW